MNRHALGILALTTSISMSAMAEDIKLPDTQFGKLVESNFNKMDKKEAVLSDESVGASCMAMEEKRLKQTQAKLNALADEYGADKDIYSTVVEIEKQVESYLKTFKENTNLKSGLQAIDNKNDYFSNMYQAIETSIAEDSDLFPSACSKTDLPKGVKLLKQGAVIKYSGSMRYFYSGNTDTAGYSISEECGTIGRRAALGSVTATSAGKVQDAWYLDGTDPDSGESVKKIVCLGLEYTPKSEKDIPVVKK